MTMLPASMRSGRNDAIVDALVDEAYLRLIDSAWEAVKGHAQDLLTRVEEVSSAGSYPLEWLRAAAGHESTGAEVLSPNGPSASVFALATASYPGFLAGKVNGSDALFAGKGLQLWQRYYQSENPLYAPLNEAAATALAERVLNGRPLRVLEVGAGTGGATAAALAAIARTPVGPVYYLATDISVRLLRLIETRLAGRATSAVALEFERYDLDDDRMGTRVAAREFDVVLAVNALHNARELPTTLQRLSSLLREGGVLIASESICAVGEQVHQEFFLNLLPIPEHRRDHKSRFLSGAEWRSAIRDAGLEADLATNRIGPEIVLLATMWRRSNR